MVAVGQMNSGGSIEDNFKQAADLVSTSVFFTHRRYTTLTHYTASPPLLYRASFHVMVNNVMLLM
jgi:hypothetical protein